MHDGLASVIYQVGSSLLPLVAKCREEGFYHAFIYPSRHPYLIAGHFWAVKSASAGSD